MNMYRLLKNASSTANNVNFSKVGVPRSMNHCTLCNRGKMFPSGLIFPINALFCRNLSAEELLRLQNSFKKGKKYRKFKKKYTELLEIKGDKSNVTKAAVRNLSPKDVSQLTQKPEMSLENLHLSLDRNKTQSTLQVTFNPDKNCDNLLNQVNLCLVNDEDWENRSEAEIEFDLIGRNTENIDMFSDATLEPFSNDLSNFLSEPSVENKMEVSKKNHSKTLKPKRTATSSQKNKSSSASKLLRAVEKRSEEERLIKLKLQNKNRIFCEFLSSYIEACVYCDFLTLGYNTVSRYLSKHKFSEANIISSPEPFNKLIHGFASQGNIDRIMELLRMITSCNVDFNLQTFVGCFECLSVLSETPANKEKQEIILKQFTSHGFTFQSLLTQGIFVKNQREKILKFIQKIDPNFVPSYEPPVQHYFCSLLQNLNDKRHLWQSPAEEVFSNEELLKCLDDQKKIELQPFQKISSVARPAIVTEEIKIFRKKWNKLENEWRNVIRTAFETNLKNLEMQLHNTKLYYNVNTYPFFKLLNPEDYVDIVVTEIHKLLRGSETYSPCLKSLHIEVGKQVKLRFNMKRQKDNCVLDKIDNLYVKYCQWYLNPALNSGAQNTRVQWMQLLYENVGTGPSIGDYSIPWPSDLLRNIGRFLYNIIINELKLDVNILSSNESSSLCTVSAFNELPRTHGKFIREEIKPHPLVGKLYRKACLDDLSFNIELLPMVCPPIPWVSPRHGGYLYNQTNFVRLFDSMPNGLVGVPNTQLFPVFDSLNQLGSVPWRINTSILDLMIKIFVNGGSEKLKIPKPASSFDVETEMFSNSKNPVKLSYGQQLFVTRRKGEMHSLWCEALYRLSLANHFRNRAFWLPHNMDFRGRVYPVPPHLTHIGSDMARALLRFSKGKKLGPKGLDWLKIHCINLTGLKKRSSTEERLHYANEILTDILDSAENPLKGKMWWTESEDMWQTLACSMEIKAAIDSGDPQNYVSFFPVHQDGSCNGLQHYAALGRDQAGGESVNLIPSPVPQDVYSCVVALVEQERLKDAVCGNSIAVALDGFIKRKIIKQTVMTTVYGVTKYGARLQIAKQLKDVEGFPPDLVWNGSMYLVSKTFDCLREMFTSTRKIQDWLTDCAKVISSESNSCVEWETPLGLPVVQPYMKTKCITNINKYGRTLFNTKPNVMKQRNAFPPNYIHSLDSSHMMLTSIFCERSGITFVSVHDCFWTHACTVKLMSEICREQFVSLHSQPILEDLSNFFIKKYANSFSVKDENGAVKELMPYTTFHIFTKVPERGTMNLNDVLRSEFFFS